GRAVPARGAWPRGAGGAGRGADQDARKHQPGGEEPGDQPSDIPRPARQVRRQRAGVQVDGPSEDMPTPPPYERREVDDAVRFYTSPGLRPGIRLGDEEYARARDSIATWCLDGLPCGRTTDGRPA